MAKYQRKYCLEILTPDGTVCAIDAVSLVIPAADGEIGILGGHAPLVAMLGAGRMIVEDEAGKTRKFFVAGGFLHVRDNAVSVMAEECIEAEKLTVAAAHELYQRAENLPADNAEALARKKETIAAAKARLKLAEEVAKK